MSNRMPWSPHATSRSEWSRREFLRQVHGAAALLTLPALGGTLLEACSTSPATTASGTPRRGGHLVLGAASDVSTFNPVLGAGSTQNNAITPMLFEGLLGTTLAGTDVYPLLAIDMPTISSDQRTYTFHLREDARWSDGTPLTSADVLFTYNLMFAPQYADLPAPLRGELVRHVESFEAPAPSTFVVHTKDVYAPLVPNNFWVGVLPQHVFAGMDAKQIATAAFNSDPTVVNGPFALGRWDRGAQIVLSRNPTYTGRQPNVDSLVVRIVTDNTVLAEQLTTGEVDVVLGAPPSAYDHLRSQQGVHVNTYDLNFVYFAGYNLDPAGPSATVLGDRAVREALAYALNRKQMVSSVFFGQGSVARSFFAPVSWAYNAGTTPDYGLDPGRAGSLLDGAGWHRGPGGVRARDGRQLSLQVLFTSSSQEAAEIAQIMQSQWKAVGANVTLKDAEPQTEIKDFTVDHSFDVVVLGIGWLPDPDQSLLFSSRNAVPGGLNGFDFKNEQADRLLDGATTTADRQARKSIYARFQDLVATEVPALPLVVPKVIVGYTDRVRGTAFGAGDRVAWYKTAWVADGK
jgi:peptide/nickel transport system substrate-binding protein